MFYNNFWGMNLLWWVVWMVVLFWIFALPYDIPGQRNRRETALDILQKRLAAGEITIQKYTETKQLIKSDLEKLK